MFDTYIYTYIYICVCVLGFGWLLWGDNGDKWVSEMHLFITSIRQCSFHIFVIACPYGVLSTVQPRRDVLPVCMGLKEGAEKEQRRGRADEEGERVCAYLMYLLGSSTLAKRGGFVKV